MYQVASSKAEEFIHDGEIVETLAYARENRANRPLIEAILQKAAEGKGVTHREAAVLLECELEDLNQRMFTLAKQIKEKIYGNRIVMFAPLYLSNYCINGCVYCPYHQKNKTIPRRKLTQEEIRREVIALQDMGHKRLALEAGEDPRNNPIEYILESIKTIYSVHHKNGAIRRVNVNIAATTVENYRKLRDAGIGTYILFQETYNKTAYEALHPTGPKSDYAYHTEAMDRAMEGGIDDVGIGVLFGLNTYRYDFTGLLMHAEHLEARFGVGPHTISEQVLEIGISQISGGSRTSVGGYAETTHAEQDSAQFDVSDHRTLDEVVRWLLELGYVPSFCTACYREGRTGDRFMSLVKTGKIADCCTPNALMTLKEYLEDYASPETRALGEKMISKEVPMLLNERVRRITEKNLAAIAEGKRDFRF